MVETEPGTSVRPMAERSFDSEPSFTAASTLAAALGVLLVSVVVVTVTSLASSWRLQTSRPPRVQEAGPDPKPWKP